MQECVAPDQATESMLSSQLLDFLPLWGVFLLTLAVLLLASEGGYRLGRGIQKRRPDRSETNLGTIVGAALAFLGFLLAFLTGTAVNIFNGRVQLVVQEANAIGTTYLRAGYLDEPYSTESRQLLREYVDTRLAALDQDRREAAIARSEEIHMELWRRAEIVARESPVPTISIYISALNEVIDLHEQRVNLELGIRIPPTILLGLYLVGILTMALIGLHHSHAGQRNLVALVAMVLILSMVFYLIVDLDRSQQGLLKVPQTALLDLQRQLSALP